MGPRIVRFRNAEGKHWRRLDCAGRVRFPDICTIRFRDTQIRGRLKYPDDTFRSPRAAARPPAFAR
jgi:uncharacterized protein YfaT (DUF1175 family)